MKNNEKLIFGLKALLLCGVFLYFAMYLFIAFNHMRYPYELEWMEGGIADHVQRLATGQSLYVKPSLDFIPYTYTPLYYYACLPAVKLLGMSFMPMRLVSFVASLGCILMIFLLVWRENKSLFGGMLASGLYVAAYRATGDWYDMVRADSLFMLLLLLSAYLLRFRSGAITLLFAGIFAWLSFMTKQTALFVGLAMAVYSIVAIKGWRKWLFPATFFGAILVSTLVLNRLTHGWYYYYIFGLPAHHAIVLYRIFSFWLFDLGAFLAVPLGVAAFWVVRSFRKSSWRQGFFYLTFFGGLVGAAWLVRMRTGSYTNTLIPAYAAVSLGFGLGVSELLNLFQNEKHFPEKCANWGLFVVLLLTFVPFLALIYEPQAQLPSEKDKLAGDKLVKLIRDTDGEVFLPGHGFISSLAGKKMHAQRVALRDILRDENSKITQSFQQEFTDEIASGRFSMIILDDDRWFTNEMAHSYSYTGKVFDDDEGFWPVSGRPIRPKSIYMLTTNK